MPAITESKTGSERASTSSIWTGLSSEVRLNVDLDTVLTVVANGCCRWLASRLHGFENVKPKRLFRKFVETAGAVEIERGRRVVVCFDRRSHNPILREAELDKDCPPIP